MHKHFVALILASLTNLGCTKATQFPPPFINGMNIAWVKFGEDVGTGQAPLEELSDQFEALARSARGGNPVARIWLHSDARLTPEFQEGRVVSPGTHAPEDLKAILDLAHSKGIKVLPVLWSHDLLRTEGMQPEKLKRNRTLFTDDRVLTSYMENGLKPLVQVIDGHPALFAWEICNEPEGMTVEENWDIIAPKDRLKFSEILKFVSKQAAAIRSYTKYPVPITVGSVSAKYIHRYKDRNLARFGGEKSYLDFYEIHYYQHMPLAYNPFIKSAKAFALDKPVLVGEFFPSQWQNLGLSERKQLYIRLRERGYLGAMAWKDGAEPDLEPILESIDHNRKRDW